MLMAGHIGPKYFVVSEFLTLCTKIRKKVAGLCASKLFGYFILMSRRNDFQVSKCEHQSLESYFAILTKTFELNFIEKDKRESPRREKRAWDFPALQIG